MTPSTRRAIVHYRISGASYLSISELLGLSLIDVRAICRNADAVIAPTPNARPSFEVESGLKTDSAPRVREHRGAGGKPARRPARD